MPLVEVNVRRERLEHQPPNILVHNLAKRIPFQSDSVDVVYHSHLLERFDRDVARRFLLGVRRVLLPGRLQRIVVPDLEVKCRDYLVHIDHCEGNLLEAGRHDAYISAIIEQCVRRESVGVSRQSALRRRLENVLRGDARRRGETHQWM